MQSVAPRTLTQERIMDSNVSRDEAENTWIPAQVTSVSQDTITMISDEKQPSLVSQLRFNYFRLVHIINLNIRKKETKKTTHFRSLWFAKGPLTWNGNPRSRQNQKEYLLLARTFWNCGRFYVLVGFFVCLFYCCFFYFCHSLNIWKYYILFGKLQIIMNFSSKHILVIHCHMKL